MKRGAEGAGEQGSRGDKGDKGDKETGTQHQPGIQPTDVTELLEKGAKVVVLTGGMLKMLQMYFHSLSAVLDKKFTHFWL